MGKNLELAIGVLNGVLGDYLERTDNGLAMPMELVHRGKAGPRVVLLVHGLGCTESIWTFPNGDDYGALLARDLGYSPVYVRFNSGLAIEENGAALARLLETLCATHPVPVEEILLLGYSLGGLVVRNACRVARREGHGWLGRVRRAIYVATPPRGAPLERLGRSVARLLLASGDPYARLAADIGNLRSSGVKDLGDGDPIPLLRQIRHYLIAGTSDAMVPVPSASDAWKSGPVKVLEGVGHVELAHHPDVFTQIRAWCEESSS